MSALGRPVLERSQLALSHAHSSLMLLLGPVVLRVGGRRCCQVICSSRLPYFRAIPRVSVSRWRGRNLKCIRIESLASVARDGFTSLKLMFFFMLEGSRTSSPSSIALVFIALAAESSRLSSLSSNAASTDDCLRGWNFAEPLADLPQRPRGPKERGSGGGVFVLHEASMKSPYYSSLGDQTPSPHSS
jgi:hypothetical protein